MGEPSIGRPTAGTWVILGLLIVAGLVVRMAAVPSMGAPFPADAAYYWDAARNVATGRGLVIDYVWMYDHGIPDRLPVPSHGYWMPGMSLYVSVWLRLLGTSWTAGQLAAVTLSVPFMFLVWLLGREVVGRDGPALLAVGIAAVDPTLVVTSITPNAAMLEGVLLGWGLLLLWWGLHRDPRWLWPAGLLAGLAQLSRNDAALVVPVAALVGVAWVRSGLQARPRERPGKGVGRGATDLRGRRLAHALYWLVPYALVMGPWVVRNTLVFGSPSPPEQWRLMFLPHYHDIFRANLSSITIQEWLAVHHGWRGGLRYDLLVVLRMAEWMVGAGANTLLLFAAPYLWLRRPEMGRPYLYLFGLLCLVYGFVVPEVAIGGGYTQAFTSVLPLLYVAAAGGVCLAGEWVAARSARAGRAVATAVIGLALLGQTVVRLGSTLKHTSQQMLAVPVIMDQDLLRAFFQAHPPADEPVLVNEPWSFHPLTGRPCLMAPTDGIGKVMEVARWTGARYLVLTGEAEANRYPSVREAVAQGRLAVVRAMPTLAAYQGLHIIDLRSEEALAEARRGKQAGMRAAGRGDYPAAIAQLEAAARLVVDYPEPSRALAADLAGAHFGYGRALEGRGELRAAVEEYARAEESAPTGFDTRGIIGRREALERRVGRRAPPPPILP